MSHLYILHTELACNARVFVHWRHTRTNYITAAKLGWMAFDIDDGITLTAALLLLLQAVLHEPVDKHYAGS